MSSEFTYGDNSDKLSILQFFLKKLVDRDLTEYQITQTLTLSRLHAQLEQSDCLITLWSKQVIFPFNAVRFVRIRGVTSWN